MKIKCTCMSLQKIEGRTIEYKKDQILDVSDIKGIKSIPLKWAEDMVNKGVAIYIDDNEKAITSKNYENKAIIPENNKSDFSPKKDVSHETEIHKNVKIKPKKKKKKGGKKT